MAKTRKAELPLSLVSPPITPVPGYETPDTIANKLCTLRRTTTLREMTERAWVQMVNIVGLVLESHVPGYNARTFKEHCGTVDMTIPREVPPKRINGKK